LGLKWHKKTIRLLCELARGQLCALARGQLCELARGRFISQN